MANTVESITAEREAAITAVGGEYVVVALPGINGLVRVRAQVVRLRSAGEVELRLCGSGLYSGGYAVAKVSDVVVKASERGFISARSAAPLAAAAGLVLAFWGFLVALGIACDSGIVR